MRLLAAGALCLLAFPAAAVDEVAPAPAYDWVFFYYMAYDNNLEAHGRPILNMLRRGVRSEKVAVLCSADFRDEGGMKRYFLTTAGERTLSVRGEGSAEVATLARELAFLAKALPAKRYALVFLDHGGQLAQMSQDRHPEVEGGPEWLRVPEVAEVLGTWRKSVPGEVELLFVQQCGKGTLSNYYAFRDAARFVMGSQTRVGAPNRYYSAVLEHVCGNPGIDGRELAAKILEHEAVDMFTTYTVFDSAALRDLPGKLDAALRPLLAIEGRPKVPALDRFGAACYDFDPDERFYDGRGILAALYEANGLDRGPLDEFFMWVGEKLIAAHRVSPRKAEIAGDWCGFSLFLPKAASAFDRYPDYALFKASRLAELVRRLLP